MPRSARRRAARGPSRRRHRSTVPTSVCILKLIESVFDRYILRKGSLVGIYESSDTAGAAHRHAAACDGGDGLAGRVAGRQSRPVRSEGRRWRKKSLRPSVADGSSRSSGSGAG